MLTPEAEAAVVRWYHERDEYGEADQVQAED